MYITRWLAGHPLIAIWVLGIIAILLSWSGVGVNRVHTEQSATENHHAEVQLREIQVNNDDTQLNQEQEQAGSEQGILQSNKTDSKDHSDVTASVSVKAETTSLPKQAKQLSQDAAPFENPAHKAVNTTGPSAIKPGANQSSSTKKEVSSVVSIPSTTAQTKTSAKLSSSSSTSGSHAKTSAVQDLSAMGTEDMLVMAREAYWNNGLDEASQIYIKLIELEPDVLEHKGELGNVYWRQGYPEKAAKLYSEVAIPMIKEGDGERVANMIGFIGLFYPDRAAEINRQLQAQKSNVHE